ncbi:phage antirepressor KilAC domain-containing protein [Nostoc sp. UHCC 0252]|uniref:phage antirepressor KilAC domain-containing protein n=1 Tax=Nostoc sp. UHCC 0252 TaxID=3110241 RepID=UPI002B219AD7|nr:phage antirepressor KilAC domain-containing protein [Nostoc sp. UHCC 0252]MEA5603691.1 phage antirepressor KilAC domain-containing protein [Nostoc sp. UHCC 0252]
MTNLTVQTINSILVVDSRLIAAEVGIEHRALKQVIKSYEADFAEFGNINISNVDIIGPGKPETFYYLTEDQSYLALTYVKNTAEARQAKKNLIHAFKAAREALAQPTQPKLPSNYKEALLALVEAEEEKERLAFKAAIAESKVIEMQPKVAVYDVIAESGKLLSFADAAKVINSPSLGRNNLMQLLRDKKILQIGNLPYQQYISQGYFEVVETSTNVGVKLTPKVTQKGLAFLIRFLQREGYTVPSKAA